MICMITNILEYDNHDWDRQLSWCSPKKWITGKMLQCNAIAVVSRYYCSAVKTIAVFFLILLQYYYNVVAVFLRYYCSTINTIAVVSRCYCVYLWERVGHKPGLRRTWTLVGTWLQLGRRGNGRDVPKDSYFYISQSMIFKRCKMPFAKCLWLFLGRIENDTCVLKDSSLS